MEQVIYIVALVVYGIFIIRFILSWIGGDFDLDGDIDLDVSDVVSFKGLTHFLMGASGWLSVKQYTTHSIMWYDYLIAFCVGILFIVMLFQLYKFMMKLESKPTILTGKDLVGSTAIIYNKTAYDGVLYKYDITVNNGNGTIERPAVSDQCYQINDVVTIKEYDGAYYII